jgi:hypothetical protein
MPTQNKLFNFGQPLPSPFSKTANKKIKVSSAYGNGAESTLCAPVIKAVNAFCRLQLGQPGGALGMIGHRVACEYKSSAGPDLYHVVVFDGASGAVMASVYDKNVDIWKNYSVGAGKSHSDGAAIIMALIPSLLGDKEFFEAVKEYQNQMNAGFSDVNAVEKTMAVICDNAYRRIVHESCPANVKVAIEPSGNFMRISQFQLDSGTFTPTSVLAGEFCIFAQQKAHGGESAEPAALAGFEGAFRMNPARALSNAERLLVPKLEPWYIIPDEVISVCKHASVSTGKPVPMRNFLLRGPAGTGKTAGAKAIAAGLGLPYMKYTCSANTEVFDFVGMVFPDTATVTIDGANLDAEMEAISSMGGITYGNIAKIINLPGLDDMDYDPAGTYTALTGEEKPEAAPQDCMAAALERVTSKIQQLCQAKPGGQGGQTYTYTETDFIKALKNGYLIEIQEPATVIQPGVLVGLNSLLEQAGSVTLPTGEVINRHPDAVVVVTTNVDYEGCRNINQSVTDRMSLILDMELPTPEVMAQRAMSVTGYEDSALMSQMVQVVSDISEYCRKNGIADGSFGMRGLMDWIVSTEITGDPYESALHTVISKASANEDDRAALIISVLEPIFAPKRRRGL